MRGIRKAELQELVEFIGALEAQQIQLSDDLVLDRLPSELEGKDGKKECVLNWLISDRGEEQTYVYSEGEVVIR